MADKDDEEQPPDLEEADALGDKIWGALKGEFKTCGGCRIPWRVGDVVCRGCGWFPDPVRGSALN